MMPPGNFLYLATKQTSDTLIFRHFLSARNQKYVGYKARNRHEILFWKFFTSNPRKFRENAE